MMSVSALRTFDNQSSGSFSEPVPSVGGTPSFATLFGMGYQFGGIGRAVPSLPLVTDLVGQEGGTIQIRIDSADEDEVSATILANNLGANEQASARFALSR
jgi:hypothetical protein